MSWEVFSDLSRSVDIFVDAECPNFATTLNNNGFVDGCEVLEDVLGSLRKFNNSLFVVIYSKCCRTRDV